MMVTFAASLSYSTLHWGAFLVYFDSSVCSMCKIVPTLFIVSLRPVCFALEMKGEVYCVDFSSGLSHFCLCTPS